MDPFGSALKDSDPTLHSTLVLDQLACALQKAKYRWQVVHGPLQALQAYLLDYDFDLSNAKAWKRTGYGGIPDCELSLAESWPLLNHKLQEEFRWQRLLRLTRYEGCHDLERQLDWQISHVIQKYTDDKLGPALRALRQGTYHGVSGTCPLRGVDLTFKHLLWECKFWHGKVKDLPAQWKQRLEAGTEPELWQRGMVQSIFYIQEGGMGTFVTEGIWTPNDTFDVPPGHALTLAVAQTCKEVRHKRFVFAIALYHVFSKQRKAALKGIVPGKATKARAVFYGLKHLALHVKDKVNIGINVHAVWRAWSPTRAYEAFPDLYQGLDFEDFDQVRPLLFAKSEVDSNETRKAFQDDADRLAKAFAHASRNEEILDLQRHIDEDTRDVLHIAGARMDILMKDRSHFLHQGPALQRETKVAMIQQKKMILDQLLAVPDQGGHQWQPYRSGVRCQHCRHRLHTNTS